MRAILKCPENRTVETKGSGWKDALDRLCQYRKSVSYYPIHPSPKAEPFKRWLAKVGYERVQEIEDPELAQNVLAPFTKPKVILTAGSRKECAHRDQGRSNR